MSARINHVSINARNLQESVDFYLRDPAGNLVEVDHHGVDRLPDDLRGRLTGLWELNPQSDEHMAARLFVAE